MGKSLWQRGKKENTPATEEGETAPEEQAAVEFAPEDASVSERERQLHGLAVLSLFLHSTATIQEMMSMLLEQASTVTGAVFVYPLLLDRKRQLMRGSAAEGCNDSRLEAAMDAFQEDLTALEFSLVQNQELYRILDNGEVAVRDGFGVLMDGTLPKEQWKLAEEELKIEKLAFVPLVVESEPLGMVVFAFDQDDIDVEALEREFALTWFAVHKQVGHVRVVQFEQLIGEITAFLPSQYIEVSREGTASRFLPIKAPADLEAAQGALRRFAARAPTSSRARRSIPTTSSSPVPGTEPPSVRPSRTPGCSASSSIPTSTGRKSSC